MILIFALWFKAMALGLITKLVCFGKQASFFAHSLPHFSPRTKLLALLLCILRFSYKFVSPSRAEGCFPIDILAHKSLQCLHYAHTLTDELEKQRERSLAHSMVTRIYQLPCSCSGFPLLCPRASVEVYEE